MAVKIVAKTETSTAPKEHRYVAQRNIAKMRSLGWKEIDSKYGDVTKSHTSQINAQRDRDVILMEK